MEQEPSRISDNDTAMKCWPQKFLLVIEIMTKHRFGQMLLGHRT